MSATDYECVEELRSEAVRDATTVNGIDYLEVLPGQTRLEVHFLHPLPGETGAVPDDAISLDRRHVVIEGGDRVKGLLVESTSAVGDVLTVTVSGPGDFSAYRLRLRDPVTGRTPQGYDPALSELEFSFKAGCPSRFDCRRAEDAPPPAPAPPVRDYLAKDYDSFRQLMLDRLATTIPGWTERNPSDQQIALVELLAYVADRLSYEQDAVATEAYLGTARRRVSVRRHARLLGYRMHEGCAARTFVHLEVKPKNTNIEIGAERRFLTGADESEPLVFQPLHDVVVKQAHNQITIHTWTDEQCYLPAGSTSATLQRDTGLALKRGDFLLFEETADSTGDPANRDRTHRHVVRLTEVENDVDPLDGQKIVRIAWAQEDALPFAFRVSSMVSDAGATTRVECGVARGNMVLVEHGARAAGSLVLDTRVDVAGTWRPGLGAGRPTWAVPVEDPLPPDVDGVRRRPSAAELLSVDPRDALPVVEVVDAEGTDYHPRRDLLASTSEDAHFVVESDDDGTTTLRFGDGTYGRRPNPSGVHTATYRTGHGTIGNIGAEAISVMEPADERITAVTNPLPATGGADPEPTEKVRADAPHAFRVQERAVTEADYGTLLTERFPGVQRATGRMRWTGSWYTAFVTVDRVGGGEVDADHRRRVARFLDGYRMAGVDVDVSRPVPVPLEVELEICASTDRFSADVERDVLDALSSRRLPDGRLGLFHADNFTFGTPVYLSRVYAAALTVPGVATVRATRFRRFGQADRGELEAGVLRVHDLEIAQLANDPDVPERGVLTVSVAGGR